MTVEIIKMTKDHWVEVSKIYTEGIKTANATFEQKCPSWEEWDKGHRNDCRSVGIEEGEVIGWAALSPVSGRCVYGGVAEVSVYVSERARGKGFGKLLLENLVNESEEKGIWTLQAGIFPENESSIYLHEKCGFRVVGVREKLGKMNGIWRDVVLLERRTKTIN